MARPSKKYEAFATLTARLLSVSKETLNERLAEYKERAALNPNKRGPKPKTKTTRPSASRVKGA
jgi:hypothetical protein